MIKKTIFAALMLAAASTQANADDAASRKVYAVEVAVVTGKAAPNVPGAMEGASVVSISAIPGVKSDFEIGETIPYVQEITYTDSGVAKKCDESKKYGEHKSGIIFDHGLLNTIPCVQEITYTDSEIVKKYGKFKSGIVGHVLLTENDDGSVTVSYQVSDTRLNQMWDFSGVQLPSSSTRSISEQFIIESGKSVAVGGEGGITLTVREVASI